MAAYLDIPSAVRRRRAFLAALTPMVGRSAALEAIDIWENAFGSEQPLWRGVSQFSSLVIQELNWKIKPEDLALRLVEHLQLAEQMLPPDPGAPRRGALNSVEQVRVDDVPAPTPAMAPTPAHVPAVEPEPLARPATTAGVRPTESFVVPAIPANPAVDAQAVRRIAADSNASPPSRTLCALLRCMRDAARTHDARLEQEVISSFVAAANAQLPQDIAQDLEALVTGASLALAHDYPKSRAVAVINLFYVVLAQVHGPVDADQLLTASVRLVERMPEARGCAPRDLL